MATSSSNQLYPFSTEDNKAIPLDIIRPLAILKQSISSASIAAMTFDSGWAVASFYSPTGCIVQFVDATITPTLADDTAYTNTLFVPPNCVVTSTVTPGAARVIGLGEVSYVVAQQIQKWAGIALQRQLSNI